MLRVDLYGLNQCALIVHAQSGVIYQNQVCGTLCRQNEAEGVLVPFDIEVPLDSPHLALDIRFRTLLLEVMGLTEELALSIDRILADNLYTSFVSVDRTRLDESCEAWVYVDIREAEFSTMRGFGACKGILTWPNSD